MRNSARLAEPLTWWVALAATWLLASPAQTTPELVLAALFGLPAAVMARAGRQAMGLRWSARLGWLGWAVRLPASVAADTVRVLRLTAADRAHPGVLSRLTLPEEPDEARAATRAALAALALSCAPGSVVLDVTAGRLLLHGWGDGPPRLSEAVTR